MRVQKPGFLFGIFIAIVAWCALGLQLYLIVSRVPGNGMSYPGAIAHFLLFFTILTNILVATSLTLSLIAPSTSLGYYFAKPTVLSAINVYIVFVGIVYNIILRGIYKLEGMDRLADELLHVVVPFLFLLYWGFYVSKKSLRWNHVFPWLIYPAVYFIYAVVRGVMEDFYAYPFLNVEKHGYPRVALNAVFMIIAFLAVSVTVVALGKLSHRGTRTEP